MKAERIKCDGCKRTIVLDAADPLPRDWRVTTGVVRKKPVAIYTCGACANGKVADIPEVHEPGPAPKPKRKAAPSARPAPKPRVQEVAPNGFVVFRRAYDTRAACPHARMLKKGNLALPVAVWDQVSSGEDYALRLYDFSNYRIGVQPVKVREPGVVSVGNQKAGGKHTVYISFVPVLQQMGLDPERVVGPVEHTIEDGVIIVYLKPKAVDS